MAPLRYALIVASMLATTALARAEPWGAIAVDNNGIASWSWNAPTGADALKSVTERCKKAGGVACVNSAMVSGKGWAAAVRCLGHGKQWGVVGSGYPNAENPKLSAPKVAIAKAFQTAIKGGFTKRECKLRGLVAADGSHMKFKK